MYLKYCKKFCISCFRDMMRGITCVEEYISNCSSSEKRDSFQVDCILKNLKITYAMKSFKLFNFILSKAKERACMEYLMLKSSPVCHSIAMKLLFSTQSDNCHICQYASFCSCKKLVSISNTFILSLRWPSKK